MKAPLARIATRLYAEPWLITSAKYHSLSDQFQAAMQSRGQGLPRVWDDDDGPKKATVDEEKTKLLVRHGIAYLSVDGIIGKNLSWLDTMCGGCDLAYVNRVLLEAEQRADVRTVLIHFNTPGGAAAGVADTAKLIEQVGQTKRVVAYIDEACSGGQWLAAATQHCYIGESALAGSISAVCSITDASQAFAKEGLSVKVFTDGKLKGTGIWGTALTDDQSAELQRRVEYIGGEFKSYIKARRPSVTDDMMQGQVFYGKEAVMNGLADQMVACIEHAIEMELSF